VANQLVSLSALNPSADLPQEITMEPTDVRSFLYSLDCPEGRIFEGAEAIAAAVGDGWVDSPANLSDAPAAKPKKASGGKKATANDDSE
jgi:hypothetical protein